MSKSEAEEALKTLGGNITEDWERIFEMKEQLQLRYAQDAYKITKIYNYVYTEICTSNILALWQHVPKSFPVVNAQLAAQAFNTKSESIDFVMQDVVFLVIGAFTTHT